MEFRQIDSWRWVSFDGKYVIICICGEWYWYLTRITDTVKVDSYESAVAACQKHFEEKSNVG